VNHSSGQPPASAPTGDRRPARARRGSPDTPPTARLPGCATARHAAGTQMRAAATRAAGTATRESLTVPGGHHDQAHAARVFTAATLTEHHPCAAVAVLLVSELVTNSMLHSNSRLPGGTITITVTGSPGGARVEVRDAGSASVPVVTGADDALAEHGRGLRLVSDLAARWGYRREPDGLVTWFEVRAEPPPS
jgi:anti-sigma regulatory factor (Ser/Thr protein kinase)